ncbi:lipoprotein-anchoring transpeptidase ErfK/SrfK [Sphingomonas jinjuensis]|uniref:Lipoprotein-anchoring transpeptidase ErfK/SrfK n=1 Tax=Sphingomonas jinjuensis TaxID=535907 RepID=A0A840FFH2_9SPHN|nr:L,D-transpeptidase family protein [Sphingomonas jinjuensis]MBB4154956.1 lipoprotein-anchoring transpeptidase ErfK/SrfK [Sphingomonas jinjuensis]
MFRLVAMIVTALAVMSASPAAAGATEIATAAQSLTPNKFVWADDASMQPVSVVISIPDQRAYVYRGDQLIAASSVSTGKDGKETPVGVFTILQKKEDHKSNLYDAAPMPFMQRLTWDGVAIHAGRNPGFPASHGCIRVPAAFAKKLFAITNVGTPVLVTEATADEGWTLPDPADATETATANQQIAAYP